jgi:hypothetical protein
MSTTVDKMAALNTRVEDLDKELVELAARRNGLAIDYAAGNKSAQKECAQIDAATDAARRERETLSTAIHQLQELAEAEQHAVLDKFEEQRQTKAADLAESICDTNTAIDLKLAELCSLLKLRVDNLSALKSLGIVDVMYLNRHRDFPTAAFAAAGLSKYIALHTPSPQAIRPLAASNSFFTNIGKPPAVERVKASEDA